MALNERSFDLSGYIILLFSRGTFRGMGAFHAQL